jgi:hypothetical protein
VEYGKVNIFKIMIGPTYSFLNGIKSTGVNGYSCALGVHPNPRFYKYIWWVFWSGSPVEGSAFLDPKYALSTSAFVDLVGEMRLMGESYILYNRQLPRHEIDVTPFDLTSPKWKGRSFAPAWDKDCDPVVVDNKSSLFGHR